MFDRLNSYHQNFEITIELNHRKYETPNLPASMVAINSIFTRKVQNYLNHGPQKHQNAINER